MTIRYTPQHNGVAERSKNLDNCFWVEVVACACYLINRTSTKSLSNKTPQEAWSGYKPIVAHLRTFGVLHTEKSKAYKLFNPVTRKTIISRDVVFEENKAWDKSLQDDSHTTQISNEIDTQNEKKTDQGDQDLTSVNTPTVSTFKRIDLDEGADFALYSDADPLSFEEAYQDQKWKDAMDKEIEAIMKNNNTWVLVDLPKNHKPIGVKWIYKTKLNERGKVDRYKARLVVKGYTQKYGIDYQKVFAPVIRLETVRLVLALAAQHNWKVHQMDVKAVFLNGNLEEDVYTEQPEGYIKRGEEHKTKLDKTIFVGYSEKSKLFNPVTRKTIISRDVVFEENKAWDKSLHDDSHTRHISNEIDTQNEKKTDQGDQDLTSVNTPTVSSLMNDQDDQGTTNAASSSKSPTRTTFKPEQPDSKNSRNPIIDSMNTPKY
ncbi:hypothetical protein OSB04_009902 [Centaurea solstitialis]|uniref:Reverse transcriptase Ty1/copia-type domain-containing protein n=1 Tax=Centaurea solstitialis TaxID=347529 RepID=A0AA38TE23_9ASTR|nr:hypothetical protein OSB04_009902 [Centaurea solstitialis]